MKNKVLSVETQELTTPELLSYKTDKGIFSKAGSRIRKVILLTCLAGTGIFFTGCFPGYVASEPSYVQYDRPARPNSMSVWIDGDWGWNNQTHVYVQRAGYWDRPRQGQSYVSGSWRSTPNGKSWSKGHWQKDNKKR